MAQDAFGNWISNPQPPAQGDLPASMRGVLYGAGAPSSDLGRTGQGYINTSNGDWYTKKDTGWELQAGGGGGGASVTTGTVDPEGVETAEVGTIYVNTSAKKLFVKESGSGNTGWTQYI